MSPATASVGPPALVALLGVEWTLLLSPLATCTRVLGLAARPAECVDAGPGFADVS